MKRPDARKVYLFLVFSVGFLIALGFSLSYYETTAAGLNPLQLLVIGAALSISRLIFEVPTGVVADLYSRRLSVLIGLALIGLAMIVEGLFPLFIPILLAQVIWGLGYTFTSGANEAWLSDEIGEERANQAFLTAKRYDLYGNLAGILSGMFLGSFTSAATLILVSGAGWILLTILLAFLMPENGFKPVRPEDRNTFQQMGDIFRNGLRNVHRRPTLLTVLGVTLFFSLTFGLDRLWTWHLVNNFDLPIPFGNNALGFFGLLDLGGILLSILLTRLVEQRFATLRPRQVSRLMFAITVLTAAAIAAFGWVPFLWMAVVLFLLIYSLGEVSDPLLLAWMNQRLDSDARATILSMIGQAESVGQAVGGLLVGFLANLFTVPLALLAISVFLIPALGLIRRSNSLVDNQD
ncbi:MAG: MFS transporter [Anaerolineales bacterium]|jgi:DHA3 family tetracycline resistance protein-like MFS transporter|nr:MFS transporter [Anaerolineales bacterium]